MLDRVLDDTHSDEVRRVVPTLTLARFAANAVYRYAPPFIATIARGLDVDIADIGVGLAIAEASGLASPLVGRLVDRIPRRVAMTGGMFGMAAGAVVAGASPGVAWFSVGLLDPGDHQDRVRRRVDRLDRRPRAVRAAWPCRRCHRDVVGARLADRRELRSACSRR